METETFATWFNHFEDFLTERPSFLLFDGHLVHISITRGPVLDLLKERGKDNFINE